MAARYWVGGTAAWDATVGTKWALTSGGAGGQAVPLATDDVFLDAASGANTVTVSSSRTCLSLNCTGFTGTLAGTGAPILTVSGNITLVASMTLSSTLSTWLINGPSTVNLAGLTLAAVQLNSGVVTMASDFRCSGNFVFTAGTFTVGAFNVYLTGAQFSSTGTGVRVLNMGSGTWYFDGTGAMSFLISGTNVTVNKQTSSLSVGRFQTSGATNVTTSINWNTVTLNYTFQDWSFIITGTNDFDSIVNAATAYGTISFSSGANTFIAGWVRGTQKMRYTAPTSGVVQASLITFTPTPIDLSDAAVLNLNVSGAGAYAVNSVDLGNNTGINFIYRGARASSNIGV